MPTANGQLPGSDSYVDPGFRDVRDKVWEKGYAEMPDGNPKRGRKLLEFGQRARKRVAAR